MPIRFDVSIPAPETHLVEVEMTIHGLGDDGHIDVALPVWTPGSYLVREYAQHVQDVTARDSDGERRSARKTDKTTWRVDCRRTNSVTVSYTVYGHRVNARYNHVDSTHAFLHGPALFFHPIGRLDDSVELSVHAPDGWDVFTGLTRPEASHDFFTADDFDELYDCPLAIGHHRVVEFDACDTPHRLAIWGRGNYDVDLLRRDLPKIVEANASLFDGDVPYEEFLFICLVTDGGRGGLEHRNSTVLMHPRFDFHDEGSDVGEPPLSDEKYLDFLNLVAHEHFHVWNVKRIRPERLGPFDYARENYTRDLWTVEGITSYYQSISLLRAGLIDAPGFLEVMAKRIRLLESIPGRHHDSLEDASFDAWIKLYRPHEHNTNSTVSYYLKGALVAMLLDMQLRDATDGEASLDDVMRHLWTHYSGDQGYPEGAYASIVEDVTGVDVGEFFDTFVRGRRDPDWEARFERFGLTLSREHSDEAPGAWLGMKVDDGAAVKAVRSDGPAWEAGVNPGDELVAIDEYKVTSDNFETLLSDIDVDRPTRLHVFTRGVLREFSVTPREPPHDDYRLELKETPAERPARLLRDWLGETVDALSEDD